MLTDLRGQTLLACAADLEIQGRNFNEDIPNEMQPWQATLRLVLFKVLIIDRLFPPEPVLPNTGNEEAAAVAIYMKSFPL